MYVERGRQLEELKVVTQPDIFEVKLPFMAVAPRNLENCPFTVVNPTSEEELGHHLNRVLQRGDRHPFPNEIAELGEQSKMFYTQAKSRQETWRMPWN